MKKGLRVLLIILLFFLGGVTVFMASSVLFGWFGIRELEGNYVPFVVFANLICGAIYLYAGYLSVKKRTKAVRCLIYATGLLLITSIAFAVYVYMGGVHEEKTVLALVFRTSITAILAWLSYYTTNNAKVLKEA